MKTKKRIESVVVTRSAVDGRFTASVAPRPAKRSKATTRRTNADDAAAGERGTDMFALWRFAEESAKRLTAEDLAQVPHDGAKNYRHYLYGLPKRD